MFSIQLNRNKKAADSMKQTQQMTFHQNPLEETIKNDAVSIQPSAPLPSDITELSEKYDVRHLSSKDTDALFADLVDREIFTEKEAAKLSIGAVLVPYINIPINHTEKEIDTEDKIVMYQHLADTQLALYEALIQDGKEISELKEESEQYRSLVEMLQQLERK